MSMRLPAFSRRLISSALLGLCASSAAADDPASEQLREQQRSVRQFEQQQRLEQWQRRSVPDQPPATSPEAPSPSTPAPCWPLSGVRLTGNRLLSTASLEHTVAPLIKPCMAAADINAVLLGITEHYVHNGYPASRPYLARPPQVDAPLDIVIVEGFVESIELPGQLPLSLRSAFPGMLGAPLHLPDLEQGLDQLNRLRAFEVSADLAPGELPGGTRILVQPRQVGSRWHLNSRVDNRGSALTGRHRLNLTAGLDSPLQLNDDLRVTVSTVIDSPARSEGGSLYYGVPYGDWTFALNASQSSYSAPLPEGFAGMRYTSRGSSSQQGLSADRLLWRNQQGMLSTSLRLDHKRLDSRVGRSALGQQSAALTTVEAGLNLFWINNGLWNAYLGVAQGERWFGADRDALDPKAPDPAFRKYRASLLHLRQGVAQATWRWQSELSLQYSPTPLHAVEQIVISDDQAVRGFRQHYIAGASGATWRNTLSQQVALPLALQVRPSLGLDLGWARFDHGQPSTRLAGAALGVTVSTPGHSLRLDYQQPLHASNRSRHQLERGFWVMEWTLDI